MHASCSTRRARCVFHPIECTCGNPELNTLQALIYLFLVERVWIVWNAGNSLTRRQSFVYKALVLVIMGYIVIFILLIVGRIALIRTDGACVIGLRSFA